MEDYSKIFRICEGILEKYNQKIYKPQGIKISGSGFIKALAPIVEEMNRDGTLLILQELIEASGRIRISELERKLGENLSSLRPKVRALGWKYKLVYFQKEDSEEIVILKDLISSLRDYYLENYSKYRRELAELRSIEEEIYSRNKAS